MRRSKIPCRRAANGRVAGGRGDLALPARHAGWARKRRFHFAPIRRTRSGQSWNLDLLVAWRFARWSAFLSEHRANLGSTRGPAARFSAGAVRVVTLWL